MHLPSLCCVLVYAAWTVQATLFVNFRQIKDFGSDDEVMILVNTSYEEETYDDGSNSMTRSRASSGSGSDQKQQLPQQQPQLIARYTNQPIVIEDYCKSPAVLEASTSSVSSLSSSSSSSAMSNSQIVPIPTATTTKTTLLPPLIYPTSLYRLAMSGLQHLLYTYNRVSSNGSTSASNLAYSLLFPKTPDVRIEPRIVVIDEDEELEEDGLDDEEKIDRDIVVVEAPVSSSIRSPLSVEAVYDRLFVEDNEVLVINWPTYNDYLRALTTLECDYPQDSRQIDIDLVRLGQGYTQIYWEEGVKVVGGDDFETMDMELMIVNKIKMILAWTLMERSDKNTQDVYKPIVYVQGLEQIASYFAIKFPLVNAGPLFHRFLGLFVPGVFGENYGSAVRQTDTTALSLMMLCLRGAPPTVLDAWFSWSFRYEELWRHQVFLGILKDFPFSAQTASILSLRGFESLHDLDEFFLFLFYEIPVEHRALISALSTAALLLSIHHDLQIILSEPISWYRLVHGDELIGPVLIDIQSRFFAEIFTEFSGKLRGLLGSGRVQFLANCRYLLPLLDTITAKTKTKKIPGL